MTLPSLLRPKIIFPAIIAVLLTPFPRQLGLYKFLLSRDPGGVGLLPCYCRTVEDQWGFTYEDLYGDGGASDEISAKEYRNRVLGQTALVTGANSGVGYETSLALARLGVKVTMACRNPSKCEAAAKTIREDEGVDTGTDVVTMTVDTSSLKSVQEFCQDFLSQTDDGEGPPLPLDMLFLNAGIGFIDKRDGKPLELTEDGIEKTFATNVVGHHLMY